MKIEYIYVGILLGSYITLSSASDKEKTISNIAALSLSASPTSFFMPPSTPPIATTMVSPYREPFIEGVVEILSKKYSSDKKSSKQMGKLPIIIERPSLDNQSPISFVKVSIPTDPFEAEKESSLPRNIDFKEQEAFFTMDDEE